MKMISHPHFKRFIAAAAIALALPLSAAAFGGARGPMHEGCGFGGEAGFAHPGMGGEGGMHRYLHRLNLTEAQRDRVFDIMHAQAPTLRNNMKALRQAHTDLRALTLAPDFSEARAKELADAAAAAMGEMALNRAKAARQMIEVLTPEQRQQLAEMKAEDPRQSGDGPRRPGNRGGTARPLPR
jgi:Spy/CpxP family protein refolding chaperone